MKVCFSEVITWPSGSGTYCGLPLMLAVCVRRYATICQISWSVIVSLNGGMPFSRKPSRMFLAIDSSSLPCTKVSASRLGARGPGAAVVPWQAEQTSVNFCADGFPRPPPRPAGGAPACGAPGCAVGGPRRRGLSLLEA